MNIIRANNPRNGEMTDFVLLSEVQEELRRFNSCTQKEMSRLNKELIETKFALKFAKLEAKPEYVKHLQDLEKGEKELEHREGLKRELVKERARAAHWLTQYSVAAGKCFDQGRELMELHKLQATARGLQTLAESLQGECVRDRQAIEELRKRLARIDNNDREEKRRRFWQAVNLGADKMAKKIRAALETGGPGKFSNEDANWVVERALAGGWLWAGKADDVVSPVPTRAIIDDTGVIVEGLTLEEANRLEEQARKKYPSNWFGILTNCQGPTGRPRSTMFRYNRKRQRINKRPPWRWE
jgi:hypothetical protein